MRKHLSFTIKKRRDPKALLGLARFSGKLSFRMGKLLRAQPLCKRGFREGLL